MLKAAVVVAVVMLASGAPARMFVPALAADATLSFRAPFASQECCKLCRAGKACGDSCIARDKTCHKGPGCACDE